MINLKIAIQKSGRLNEDSLTLLKECGISINNGKDQLMAQASNFRLDVLYLRNSVSGWANTSCRFDFSQERSLCLSYVYVQW